MARSVQARDGAQLPVKIELVTDEPRAIKLGSIDISNLPACIADSAAAWNDPDTGPPDDRNFMHLRRRLLAARLKLPKTYQETLADPFINTLAGMGADQFAEIFATADQSGAWSLLQDIAHSVLQRADGFQANATDAFQEVVSDLYDGFLSAEDRRGVKPPDKETLAPLVKWGNPNDGPYTWPVESTESFGCEVAVVNLPPGEARAGLMGWATLGHECGGHDITSADTGLLTEMRLKTMHAVKAATNNAALARYWGDRIDETSADVLGILNMGPAAAIGLIAYFRGISSADGEDPKLRSNGPSSDPHPADIVRGYLGAAVVRLLEFSRAEEWAKLIETETDKDLETIHLAGKTVPVELARKSVVAVAEALVNTPMEALEHHALGEIQNWQDDDEMAVAQLARALARSGSSPVKVGEGIFAAHTVAGGVYASLAKGAKIGHIFRKMVATLKVQHDGNPSWGPLAVRHPSDLHRDTVITLGY